MRKSVICFIFAILLICTSLSYAESSEEITFLGVPWLSNEVVTADVLNNGGYFSQKELPIILNGGDAFYLEQVENGVPTPTINSMFSDVCIPVKINGGVRGKIAGSPVKEFELSFAYDGELHLIYAKAELINSDYAEIKKKLNTKYGECSEIETIEGITISAWKGKENSCVVLYTDDNGQHFDLCYGRLDAAEILLQCLAAPNSDDISGL